MVLKTQIRACVVAFFTVSGATMGQAAPELADGATVFRDAGGTPVVFVLPVPGQSSGFISLSRYQQLERDGLAPMVFTRAARETGRAIGLQWAVGVWR